MWYIVLFPQENSVSAVPASWYVEQTDECFWPPAKIKKSDIAKFIKHKYLPEEDWKPYRAKLLGRYSDYKDALAKLAKAKNTDKLSSTDNEEVGRGKRKKIQKHKTNFSSSSETDESSSNDCLSFPNFSNLGHLETEKNHASLDVGTSQKHENNSTISIQQKRVRPAIPNKEDRRRKLFPRTLSRSLSPENLLSENVRSAMPDEKDCGRKLFPRTSRSLSPENLLPNVTPAVPDEEDHKRKLLPRTLTKSPSPENVLPEKSLQLHQKMTSRDQHRASTTALSSEDNSVQILRILQKMQADSSEFKVQVIRKLNLLNMKLNDLEVSLDNLRKNKDNVPSDENDDDEFINLFPLDSEKLNNLENRLVNEVEKNKLIKHLSRVGGTDVSDTVKRLMYKMFTNEVGNLFSWDGAKGKKKFKNLKLANVILNTVRCNNNTKDATEADVIIYVKKWLVRCKDRINLETKRSRLNQNEGVEVVGETRGEINN